MQCRTPPENVLGAVEGSRGRAPPPPAPRSYLQGARMLSPSWAFILTSGGHQPGRDRDPLGDRQWDGCLLSWMLGLDSI